MQYYAHTENQGHQQPVYYVGYPPQQEPRRRFNWWGFCGLLMSLGSFLTAGFASPLALLISANGLRKAKGPRKAAMAGTVFSLLGILMAGSIVAFAVQQEHNYRAYQAEQKRQIEVAVLVRETNTAINVAQHELKDFKADTGHLPNGIDGNMLMLKHVDAWGTELRYDAETTPTLLRSAGPDQIYNTDDDVTSIVKGDLKPPQEVIEFANH